MDCLFEENKHLQVISLVHVERIIFEVELSGLRVVVEFTHRSWRPLSGSLRVCKKTPTE